MKHTYSVRTWDAELQRYTPQKRLGFPWKGLSLHRLRRALKKLKRMGYSCHRRRDPDGGHDDNDWAVLVERDDLATDGVR